MMAWVAIDRAIRSAEQGWFSGDIARWRTLRNTIHEQSANSARPFNRKANTNIDARLELAISAQHYRNRRTRRWHEGRSSNQSGYERRAEGSTRHPILADAHPTRFATIGSASLTVSVHVPARPYIGARAIPRSGRWQSRLPTETGP